MLASAVMSCAEFDPQIPSPDAAGESSSFSVTIDLARHFAKVSNDDNPLMSEFPFVDGGDTLCYVFNYERGWAIVAADRRVTPVIAYDEYGSMPPSLRLDTPFFGSSIAGELSRIKQLKSNAMVEYDSSKYYGGNGAAWNTSDDRNYQYKRRFYYGFN